ncbi:MAG: metallophosphoesterase [Candidatus Marsarchaeota archaeon]|nr:metallophosphoesterase [Candidatus Marsarchaeota archaeon]MCL5413138.1 metallophosphoesterase [Candidatus Marsarchaeota archaeon]
MGVLFIDGAPALMIEKERLIVVGDLHIGVEEKFADSGISFPNAAAAMGRELRSIVEKNNASGVAILGDIKHRITNLTREDMNSFSSFFHAMDGIGIKVARGNHDAYIEDLLRRIGFDASVSKEILTSDSALMHGNAMPSEEAVLKDYIICGHGHIAAQVNGVDRKAWLVASAGGGMKEHYGKYNKNIKLIAAPAFNRLITGSRIGYETGEHLPLLNNGLFDFSNAKAYDLYGNLLKR